MKPKTKTPPAFDGEKFDATLEGTMTFIQRFAFYSPAIAECERIFGLSSTEQDCSAQASTPAPRQ